MSRRLLLLRHATAGKSARGSDHDRPLTAAGREQATAMTAAVAAHDPDLVVCSSARRALETAACIGLAAAAVPERDLYLASAAQLLTRLRQVPDTTGRVLVVGHNPGLAQLAAALDDDPRLRAGFPPATLAVFGVGRSWADLRAARLMQRVVPGQ